MTEKMVEKIVAKYRVTTPMFIGGADNQYTAELRAASFRGVLRFWWRALAWSKFRGDLDEIKKHEGKMFGSSENGAGYLSIQSINFVGDEPQLLKKSDKLEFNKKKNKPQNAGLTYLGYGVMDYKGTLEHACLNAPFEFEVTMRLRTNIKDGEYKEIDHIDLLRDALIAMGLFGGMGAKSRKGFGSLVLQSIESDIDNMQWHHPSDITGIEKEIQKMLRNLSANEPEYTAFSDKTQIIMIGAGYDRLDLLNMIGEDMIRYRSWGRHDNNSKYHVNAVREPAQQNFDKDHDLMQQTLSTNPNIKEHPERIAFGLPHNYYIKKKGKEVKPASQKYKRRASPLFIHIHEYNNGKPVAIISFLPAKFLPDKESKIDVDGTKVDLSKQDIYAPIKEFLDRLLEDKLAFQSRIKELCKRLKLRQDDCARIKQSQYSIKKIVSLNNKGN